MSSEKHLRGEKKAFEIKNVGENYVVDFEMQPTVKGGSFTAPAGVIDGNALSDAIKASGAGKSAIRFNTENIIGENKTLTFPNISGEIMVKGSTDALSVSSGGTGLKTITANALLFGNGTSSINLVSPVVDTVTPTVKHFLNSTHNAKAPVWSKITWNDITDGNTITTSNITNAIALRHTQNTDIGTNSTSFYLGGANPTNPLYLRNNAGTLEVTDNAITPVLRNIKVANITANNVSAPTGAITAPNIPSKASSVFWGTAQYSNGVITVTINDSWATTVNLTNGFSLGFISPSDTTLAATKITLINSALPPESQTLFTAKDIYIDSANKIKANSLKGAVQLRYNKEHNNGSFFLANGGRGELVLGSSAKIKEDAYTRSMFLDLATAPTKIKYTIDYQYLLSTQKILFEKKIRSDNYDGIFFSYRGADIVEGNNRRYTPAAYIFTVIKQDGTIEKDSNLLLNEENTFIENTSGGGKIYQCINYGSLIENSLYIRPTEDFFEGYFLINRFTYKYTFYSSSEYSVKNKYDHDMVLMKISHPTGAPLSNTSTIITKVRSFSSTYSNTVKGYARGSNSKNYLLVRNPANNKTMLEIWDDQSSAKEKEIEIGILSSSYNPAITIVKDYENADKETIVILTNENIDGVTRACLYTYKYGENNLIKTITLFSGYEELVRYDNKIVFLKRKNSQANLVPKYAVVDSNGNNKTPDYVGDASPNNRQYQLSSYNTTVKDINGKNISAMFPIIQMSTILNQPLLKTFLGVSSMNDGGYTDSNVILKEFYDTTNGNILMLLYSSDDYRNHVTIVQFILCPTIDSM